MWCKNVLLTFSGELLKDTMSGNIWARRIQNFTNK